MEALSTRLECELAAMRPSSAMEMQASHSWSGRQYTEVYPGGVVLAWLRLPMTSKLRFATRLAALHVLQRGNFFRHMYGYARTRR